ncbi:MAG: hypothetical protein ACM3X1_07870 [Ignavibacteriales bacterium]
MLLKPGIAFTDELEHKKSFPSYGVESTLQQAWQVAGRKDIRITGGAQTIQQFLNVGLDDEVLGPNHRGGPFSPRHTSAIQG